MQAQAAFASALKDAGVRTPVNKKMYVGNNGLKIAFLIKHDTTLEESAYPFYPDRPANSAGRKVVNQQGNIKLGGSVLDMYIPVTMTVTSGCGSNGNRMRIVFTMAHRGKTKGTIEMDLLFARFADKGYDFFELYNNGAGGHLMQLRGENENSASCFIEV